MGTILKFAAYTLVGVFAPIALSYWAYSAFLVDFPSIESIGSEANSQLARFQPNEEVEPNGGLTAEEYSLSVASDTLLDPQRERSFIVGVQFELEQLPPLGARQKIVSKYDGSKVPYPGWAIALSRFETSVRPSIYWKDSSGKGKWYDFGRVELAPKTTYRFIAVLSKNRELFGYWLSETKREKAEFLGGYNLFRVGLPTSDSILYFGSRGSADRSIRGTVHGVFVGALPDDELERTVVAEAATLPFSEIASELERQNQLFLYVDESGKDHSPYQRAVQIRGNI